MFSKKMAEMKYSDAIRSAIGEAMESDANVITMGLGVPDPGGVFGTTLDLQDRFGNDRVMDIPCAENGMTGIIIGMALGGKKVILSHQRVDFSFLSLEQLFNQASKWHFMFGGQESVPIVVRMIVGRGWGQGPQHSQFAPSLFTHFPGIKVVCPVFPKDAKSLMHWAIRNPNPVIFFEHRWLHFIEGETDELESLESETAKIILEGKDVTLVSYSYGVLECMVAADYIRNYGIEAEVIDLRFLSPIDFATITKSVKKTSRLIVLEHTWSSGSIASEIITNVVTSGMHFKDPPCRLSLPDYPFPTSIGLAKDYYPGQKELVETLKSMFKRPDVEGIVFSEDYEHDKPNPLFNGPF